MNPEEMLKKHISGELPAKESQVFAAANLMTANTTKELVDANMLLAKTTQASAELLAKTTQTSAELLAKTTQASAEELKKASETSANRMKWLTIALIILGFIQIIIAVIALFISLRIK